MKGLLTSGVLVMCFFTLLGQSGVIKGTVTDATNNETMVLDGQCFWYKEDGSIDYEVNFLEGREHGKTIFYLKNGETIVLNYDRGLMLNKE